MKYVPARDGKGRFSKKKLIKYLFVVIALVSIWGNYKLVKQFYVFKCSVGGYVMSKEACNTLYTDKMDSLELARQQFLSINSDIQ